MAEYNGKCLSNQIGTGSITMCEVNRCKQVNHGPVQSYKLLFSRKHKEEQIKKQATKAPVGGRCETDVPLLNCVPVRRSPDVHLRCSQRFDESDLVPEELISNTAQRTNPIRVKLERRCVVLHTSPVSFSAMKVQERSSSGCYT